MNKTKVLSVKMEGGRKEDRCYTANWTCYTITKSLSGVSGVKESSCNVQDPGLIPGLLRSPGGGNGNPLQYSCLENPMDRGAWQATVYGVTVHGVTKSQTRLSN